METTLLRVMGGVVLQISNRLYVSVRSTLLSGFFRYELPVPISADWFRVYVGRNTHGQLSDQLLEFFG